jgi:hypothetical protein
LESHLQDHLQCLYFVLAHRHEAVQNQIGAISFVA